MKIFNRNNNSTGNSTDTTKPRNGSMRIAVDGNGEYLIEQWKPNLFEYPSGYWERTEDRWETIEKAQAALDVKLEIRKQREMSAQHAYRKKCTKPIDTKIY